MQHQAGDIAARGFGAERHRSVQPDTQFGRPRIEQVAAEIRRNLNHHGQFAGNQPTLHLRLVGDRRRRQEIVRALEALHQGPALPALVLVEDGIGEMLDIEGDPEAEGDHHNDRAKQREGKPHSVAPQFDRLEQSVRPAPARVEHSVWASGGSRRGVCRRYLLDWPLSRLPCGVLEIADECVFQRSRPARADQVRRAALRQDLPGVHGRDPVAARGLVHKMGRDEDRYAILARHVDQALPELVALDRIDARSRLIKNKDPRPMQHRDRKLQALANAEREAVGARVGKGR